MKRTGILTYHYPINYGAVLQTYALYKYLEKDNNLDPKIINYVSERAKGDKLFTKPNSLKDIFHNILVLLFTPLLLSKKNKFKKFIFSNFKFTQRYNNTNEIDFNDFDIVITGSDQVFNPFNPDNLAYFQPFKKQAWQIKVAFSPSFGINEFSRELEAKISTYIKDFDYISCREKKGAEFISKIRNQSILNTIDPVFLLEQQDWGKICHPIPKHKKYILIYDLNGKYNLIKIAKQINTDKDIIIISTDPLAKIKYRNLNINKIIINAGIEDFVSYIKYADTIITDSFHGTAMSIIFRKNFYTYIALQNVSNRIYSLLEQLDLSNRIITESHNAPYTPTHYKNKLITDKILLSKQFLEQSLV